MSKDIAKEVHASIKKREINPYRDELFKVCFEEISSIEYADHIRKIVAQSLLDLDLKIEIKYIDDQGRTIECLQTSYEILLIQRIQELTGFDVARASKFVSEILTEHVNEMFYELVITCQNLKFKSEKKMS